MKKFIVMLAVPLAIVACSKHNNPIENVKQAAEDRDLQKTFQSDCDRGTLLSTLPSTLASGLQASTKSSRVLMSFKGANIERRTVYYTGINCDGNEAYSFDESGTFTLKDKKDKTNDGGRPIDIQYDRLDVKILSADGEKLANAEGFCNIHDWKSGKSREIKADAKSPSCNFAQIPRLDSNIYRVDAGTLYMGSFDKSAREPNQRPTSLSSMKFGSK